MTVSDNFVESKLNMRIGSKGVTREYGTDVIARADIRGDVSAHGNKMSDVITSKLPYQGQSKKRGPVTILENSIEKRRKMDRGIKILCNNMLKDLQNHRCGFPFKKPVDPVAYNIPNYFSVVKKPMDFGTIGSKLENNVYFSIDEFAADVRLTFSNCMLFNPPFNQFHVMARELSNYFESKWKFVEKKLKFESKNALNKSISNGNKEVTRGRIMMDRIAYPSMVSSINRRKMYVEEKQKLRKDLKELLKGNMTEKLQSISKKYNLFNLKESIDMGLDAMDDEVLWELKRTTKNMLKVTAGKVEATKGTQSSACSLSYKYIDKCIDNDRGVSCPSTKLTPPASSLTSKCGSCGSLSCRCSFSSNKVRSCKNFASKTEKHSGQKDASRTDLYQENLTASRSDTLDLDGNGWTPATDINMSPKKALRVAMLKSRFADTIFKARQITLLDQGDKADAVKLQWEKDKLEKQHREEKARIEAQKVAAESSSRLMAQFELKKQRQREREAARIALEQMERTVDIDDNLKFLRDLELMSQSPDSGCTIAGGPGNPLERLGLYFKEDFIDDVEEVLASSEDLSEKGEILNSSEDGSEEGEILN